MADKQRQHNGGVKRAYTLSTAGPDKDEKNLKLLKQALPDKIERLTFDDFKVASASLKQSR